MISHDYMLLEGHRRAVSILLVPSQSKVVRCQAGDNIIVPIAVDVVGIHLCAAVSRGECGLVRGPASCVRTRLGLLEPASRMQDIETTIAVDVPNSQPVAKLRRGNLVRDFVKLPSCE